MFVIQFVIFSLSMKARELFSCAASGVFISTFPNTPNFYYNTAIIASVCELRATIIKHNPRKWSDRIFKNVHVNNFLLF